MVNNRKGTLKLYPYFSLFDGIVNLREASARLAEIGKFALQILHHMRRSSTSVRRNYWKRTYVSLLLDVSPHQLVLEFVNFFLQFNRLLGFLEPIFCSLGGTEQVREHLTLLV